MNSKKVNRLDKIMKSLMQQSGVSIREFAAQLGVSEITVRRDLQYLEQQGQLRLINGVAIYRSASEAAPVYPEYPDATYQEHRSCDIPADIHHRVQQLSLASSSNKQDAHAHRPGWDIDAGIRRIRRIWRAIRSYHDDYFSFSYYPVDSTEKAYEDTLRKHHQLRNAL